MPTRRLPGALAALHLALLTAGSACGPSAREAPPRRICQLEVWYRPTTAVSRLEVTGSWSAWTTSQPLAAQADGWWLATVRLEPGEYQYLLKEDSAPRLDGRRATTAINHGREVSWARVEDCDRGALQVRGAEALREGPSEPWAVRLELEYQQPHDGRPLSPGSVTLTGDDGLAQPFATERWEATTGRLVLRVAPVLEGKQRLRVAASDQSGRPVEAAFATVWVQATTELKDLVVYQVQVDRFRGTSGAALTAPQTGGDWAGGTLDGVRRALEAGDFERLGVNALWLSPLYLATRDAHGPAGRQNFGYHGYWAAAARTIDPRYGGEVALDALVQAAHRRGVRVLFDVVPNHVHRDHPYATRLDWLGPSCVCGSAACPWTSHIQTCWFDTFLPDLSWENPEVATQVADDVAWWFERFSADGVRVDAVPMVPVAAIRRLASEVRTRFDHPGHRSFLLGENFTGIDGWGRLGAYLGGPGLDGEFHFPLLWALRSAVAESSAPLALVDQVVQRGEQTWPGGEAVMGLTVGNHDVPRFASVADRSVGDGWAHAPQPTRPEVYARQRLALGLTFVLPGVPVIYQGDELGLAGSGDPDNRRVMPADLELTEDMRATRRFVEGISAARRCHPALRRGGYQSLVADAERLAFARETVEGDWALVVAERAPLTTNVLQVPPGEYIELLSGMSVFALDGRLRLETLPHSVRIIVRAGATCALASSRSQSR